MVNLESLKNALAPVGEVGIVEETFTIQGTTLTLRPLRPAQETEVQRWAGQVLQESDDDDNASGIEYLDRFKIGCLSYSIVEINDLDLRNTDVIPTGQKLPNGTEVKVPKYKGLRDALSGWTRPVIDACFRKFGEMMEKAELSVENSVEYNPADLDSELARLEDRMTRLNALKKRRAKGEITQSMAVAVSDALQAPVVETTEPNTEDVTTEGVQSRQSIIPTEGAPVERAADMVPGPSSADLGLPEPSDEAKALSAAHAEPAPAEQAVNEEPAEDTPAGVIADADEMVVSASGTVAPTLPNEGWIDSADSDTMAAAVAAENLRIQQRRARRNVPHAAAAKANAEAATAAGDDQIPVMTPGAQNPPAGAPITMSPETPSTSTRNPKFVPPKPR